MMITNPNNMIKAAISETIVSEMFRELGFFVLRLGQEHTVEPLTQLTEFVNRCGGNFQLNKRDGEYILPISYMRKLPDLIIVDRNGETDYIEVKYRNNARISKEDLKVFELFPPTLMVVVNTNVAEDFEQPYGLKLTNIKDDLPTPDFYHSRFHVYALDEDDGEELSYVYGTLTQVLREKFGIEEPDIIKKYEHLVISWIPRPQTE